MLQMYNSLTRQKEPFTPLQPGKVGLYACGLTVYDYFHIGNARMLVVFDMIVRYLRFAGFDVNYVRNITDIDDKIIARAGETGQDIKQFTRYYIDAMHRDLQTLGTLPPDIEPRATDHVDDMTALIQTLIDKRLAYVSGSGDVLYDVSEFPGYGKLSNKNPADLRAGSRVDVGRDKDDPLDFVLWKMAKPGEPSWPSPWGDGRPGWHIECSAMSSRFLGRQFDIHGGGMDLKFPHHENEIAQSEGAHACTFVNYWLHNGFIQVDADKMSKSLGNFFTAREVLEHHRPEAVRLFLLGSHYRQPLNYSDVSMDNADAALSRLYTALRGVAAATPQRDPDEHYERRFRAAMDDDFNTPEAMAVLFELARHLNRERDADADASVTARLAATLRRLGGVLGLLQTDPETFFQQRDDGAAARLSADEVEQLIAERLAARAAKNWAEADRIRDLLKDDGVVLEDGAGATTWRRDAARG